MIRSMLGGIILGGVGVVAWVLIGYHANYEIGWIAWGIGLLTGIGVRTWSKHDGQEADVAKGIMAASIACGEILLAKFIVFSMVAGNVNAELMKSIDTMPFNNEAMVAYMSDDIVREMIQENKPVAWPPGITFEDAAKKSDYPPEIWNQAETRWNEMTDQQKEEYKRDTKQRLREVYEEIAAAHSPDFIEYFTPWDLLWFGLALVTAFKVANGTDQDD